MSASATQGAHDEVLVWLSVWSKVQVICIWSSCCHCHLIISYYFIKIQNGLTFLVLAYPGCAGKGAVEWCMPVCVFCIHHTVVEKGVAGLT